MQAALAAASVRDGKLVVIGSPGLARVLEGRGFQVEARRLDDTLGVDDASVAGVVAVARGELRGDWLRAVRLGGVVTLVSTEAPEELSRRALCAGLTHVRGGQAGRHSVVSGTVWRE